MLLWKAAIASSEMSLLSDPSSDVSTSIVTEVALRLVVVMEAASTSIVTEAFDKVTLSGLVTARKTESSKPEAGEGCADFGSMDEMATCLVNKGLTMLQGAPSRGPNSEVGASIRRVSLLASTISTSGMMMEVPEAATMAESEAFLAGLAWMDHSFSLAGRFRSTLQVVDERKGGGVRNRCVERRVNL